MKAGHWGPLSYLKNGGDGRIRTADGGFANLQPAFTMAQIASNCVFPDINHGPYRRAYDVLISSCYQRVVANW